MRLTILAVGRARAGPEADLCSDYLDRLGRTGRGIGLGPGALVEVEDRKGGRDGEARALLARCPQGAQLISLDERGKSLNSMEFSRLLARWRDEGIRDAAFAIGGADGHGAALSDAAHMRLSFGKMVWPHMLVRVMLAEQLYRAATILAGTPYHRV